MAPKKIRPTWDFGRKVARLVSDRLAAQQEPRTATDLARAVSIDPGAVLDWIQKGAHPRSSTARKVAEVLGVDAAWLTDDAASYPPPERSANLDALLRMIPKDQQSELIAILRDPMERAAWIAAWAARRGPR